jgi:hypothetical protein
MLGIATTVWMAKAEETARIRVRRKGLFREARKMLARLYTSWTLDILNRLDGGTTGQMVRSAQTQRIRCCRTHA